MVLAGVLIVGGAVLLIRVIAGSNEATVPPVPTPTVVLGCPEGQWLDAANGTCVPRAQCAADQSYDQATNTCTAPPPVLTGVRPADGPPEGGTELTITGTGFTPDAAVTINGQPGIDTRVVDATTITTTTPPSTVFYPVDVQVANSDGQVDTLDNVFTYNEPPVQNIAEIVPPQGSSQGGEAVIIKGQDFLPGAVVSFYGRPATDVVVLDAGTIRATIPAAPVGPVTVNVRNPGQAAFTLEDGFTYVDQPPRVIARMRPAEGTVAGGTPVAIVGTGFDADATVTIGGRPATEVKVVSSTRITALTPPGKVGPATVAVRNPGVPAAQLVDGFTYVAGPAITGVKPASGPITGGTEVTISGSGFAREATVTFGDVAIPKVKVVDDTTITFLTPAAVKPLKVDVTVTNPGEPPATLSRGFAYTRAAAEPPTPTPTPSGTAPAALPRCPSFTRPGSSTPIGSALILTDADLFPFDPRLDGAVLTGAALSSGAGSGGVDWQQSPPRIVWTAPAGDATAATITYSYSAEGCRGTGRGTIAVSAR